MKIFSRALFLCAFLVLSVIGFFSGGAYARAAVCEFSATEATNDFNNASNWSCGGAPAVPGVTDDVVIPASTSTNVTASVTINALFVTGTLMVADGQTLTISGNADVAAGGVVTTTAGTIIFNGATVTNAGGIGVGTGLIVFNNNITNNGVIDVGNGIVNAWVTNNALPGIINGGSGEYYIGNSFTQSGTFNAQSGTVRMNGLFAQSVPAINYYNLRVSNTGGTVSLSTDTTVSGLLTLDSSVTLSAGTNNLTVSGGGILNIPAAAVLQSTSGNIAFTSANITNNGVIRATGGGNLSFSAYMGVGATGMVTTTSGVVSFGGLVDSSGSIGTETGGILFSGAFSDTGGRLDLGAGTVTTTGNATSTGTINGGSGTLVILGEFANDGATIDPGTSIVRYQSASGSANLGLFSYYDVSLESAGSYALRSGTAISHDLAIGAGSSLTLGSGRLSVGGATNIQGVLELNGSQATSTGALTVGALGTLQNSSGIATLALGDNYTNGNETSLNSVRVRLVGDNNQYLDGFIASSLDLAMTGGYSALLNASSTIVGSFYAPGNGSLSAEGNTLTIGGSAVIGSLGVVTSTSGTLIFQGAATSSGAIGTVNGRILFQDTFDNSGTWRLGAGIATTTGQLTNSGTIYGENGAWNIAPSGSSCGLLPSAGTFTVGSSTVYMYDQSGGCYLTPYFPRYNNLVIVQGDLQSYASTTVSGTMTVRSGTTYRGQGSASQGINIRGALTNAGTFYTNGPVTVSGTFTNSGSFDVASGVALDIRSSVTNSGSLTVANDSTITYSGSGSISILPLVYGALQFTGSGTYTLTASTTALATTTVATGAMLSLDSYDFTGHSDIANTGTVATGTGHFLHPVDYVRVTDNTGSVVSSLGSGDSLYITVKDQNRNLDGAVAETIAVTFAANSAAGSDSEPLVLTETSASSGIFRNASAIPVRQASISAANGYLDLSAAGSGLATYVDTHDASDTDTGSVTLTYTAVSSGGGGGGGGGGSGPVAPIATIGAPLPRPVSPPTSSAPIISIPIIPPVVIAPAPAPIEPTPSAVGRDLSSRTRWLESLGLSPRSAQDESRIASQVRTDAAAFRVMLSPANQEQLTLFVAYGSNPATIRLGEGERRALVRDLLDTLRQDLRIEDLERVAAGQAPRARNLSQERAQLLRVRQTFRTIYGHDPNFQNSEENLAWNTLMYRIRFSRNLALEQQGIRSFRQTFRRAPQDPFQWATVRVLGYIER